MMMMISILMSLLFTQMKNPLAMGLMLLLQTLLMCLMSGFISKSFWFSYILFLVFLGGMLILFIYVISLASNEMFYLSMKTGMTITMLSMITAIMLMAMSNPKINNMDMINFMSTDMLEYETTKSLMKLYNKPTNMMTIMLILYLLLTLIAVVEITAIHKGPLRKMN
uniref:NADH-ubiquinone oxidoreductase chain 6 n=1 Tax=Tryonicus mackerrasae TaxID=2093453 RepID=A0A2P1H933_9NEOP|nr:NADH dehydrogenase subunit 6 [Tryonicus mackerrasae]